MQTKIILVGGFHEIIELCEECGYEITGIIDNVLEGDYYEIPVLGKDSDAPMLFSKFGDRELVITPDSPALRKKLEAYYRKIGFHFATIVSPSAKISKTAVIGEGTIIQSDVNVSSESRIGSFCKLNTRCNIMHDNMIGDYCTIAPNAVLLGRVIVEDQVYIGSNSTILPEITIGEHAVVGAGAVATRDVHSYTTVKGVPAK